MASGSRYRTSPIAIATDALHHLVRESKRAWHKSSQGNGVMRRAATRSNGGYPEGGAEGAHRPVHVTRASSEPFLHGAAQFATMRSDPLVDRTAFD